jgi:hypothetical protein
MEWDKFWKLVFQGSLGFVLILLALFITAAAIQALKDRS